MEKNRSNKEQVKKEYFSNLPCRKMKKWALFRSKTKKIFKRGAEEITPKKPDPFSLEHQNSKVNPN